MSGDSAESSRSRLLKAVRAILCSFPGVEEHPSQFADLPAWWVDGREVCHIGPDGWLDVRLTKAVIRKHRGWFRADSRFRLRSFASDWVEVDGSEELGEDMANLLCTAVEANRPAVLDRAPDPARVAARARRLHR